MRLSHCLCLSLNLPSVRITRPSNLEFVYLTTICLNEKLNCSLAGFGDTGSLSAAGAVPIKMKWNFFDFRVIFPLSQGSEFLFIAAFPANCLSMASRGIARALRPSLLSRTGVSVSRRSITQLASSHARLPQACKKVCSS
jgi:hypothetical protein